MRILIVEVDSLPGPCEVIEAELSAFPQLLLEGPQLWQRLQAQSPAQVIEAVRDYEPAVIAYLGSQALTRAWCQLSEAVFPRLFAIGHPPAEDESVIDAVNQRSRILRQRRLADHHAEPPNPGRTETGQLFSGLFPAAARQAARQLGLELIRSYGLEPLLTQMDTEDCERGLSLLGLLQALPETLAENPHMLDIGCHRWSYAPFLRGFGSVSGQPVLTGLELDPWYLQPDGRTRGEWARYWAGIAQAAFCEGELAQQQLPQQNLVTMLLPPILPENALSWGVPLAEHDPAGLLLRVRRLLKPAGQLLMFFGGELEFVAALSLLQGLNWLPVKHGPHHCPLRRRDHGFIIVLTVT
ncbi:MAG: hypothetical protein ACAI44_10425 [Candidatus Sericytochromatia bacterium]